MRQSQFSVYRITSCDFPERTVSCWVYCCTKERSRSPRIPPNGGMWKSTGRAGQRVKAEERAVPESAIWCKGARAVALGSQQYGVDQPTYFRPVARLSRGVCHHCTGTCAPVLYSAASRFNKCAPGVRYEAQATDRSLVLLVPFCTTSGEKRYDMAPMVRWHCFSRAGVPFVSWDLDKRIRISDGLH